MTLEIARHAVTFVVYVLVSVLSPFILRYKFHKMLDATTTAAAIEHGIFAALAGVIYVLMCFQFAAHILTSSPL